MKVGLVQYSPEWENQEDNIIKLNKIIDDQFTDEELIIFPEMTLTGFTMKSLKYSEEIDGPGTKYFIHLAQKKKVHVIAGIIERDENKIYNTLFHFDKNGIITARYRKIHPFSMAKEDKYFLPGNEPLITSINKVRIGLSICYDLRFPELYRYYGKEKVDVIVNIANWPTPRISHWKCLLKARAIENQCFTIGINRVGEDPYSNYNGCSGVIDPSGKEVFIIENEERLISIELDINKAKEIKNNFPFLEDIKLI